MTTVHADYRLITCCRGFQSINRANPLAKKILASDIGFGLNEDFTFYTADNCKRQCKGIRKRVLTVSQTIF